MEVKNPSINRPLGLALWSKIKNNIGANAFVDFSSLLHVGQKKMNKSFEITDNLGECEIKPIKQTNEISAITQCVQAFFVFVGIYTEKSQQKAPALKQYGDMVQKPGREVEEADTSYDKNFRERRAINPVSFSWYKLNSEIHSKTVAISFG